MADTNSKTRNAILALATTALLSGCGATSRFSDWLRGVDDPETSDAVIIGAPDAETYLAELYELVSGDARRKEAIYEDASSAAQLTPGPSSSLRLALVLATPGHPYSNPARAATLLQDLLAQQALLTSGELSLATVYLLNAERLAAVSGEVARLRDANEQAARDEEESANRRITAVEAENRRLREQLAEAEDKLEAITSIERTIREQQ